MNSLTIQVWILWIATLCWISCLHLGRLPDLPYPRVAHRFCAPPFDLSSGDARLPDWLSTLPRQPTVYATLGTTFNRSPGTFQAILTALSTEPVNLIMTVGRSMNTTAVWATTRPYQDRTIYSTDASPPLLRRAHLPRRLQFLAVGFLAWSADGHYSAGCRRQPPYGLAVRCSGCRGAGRGQSAATRSDTRSSQSHIEQPNYRARSQEFQREIKELPSLAEAVRRLEILAEDRSPQFCDHHLDVRSSAQAYPVETHADAG